MVPPRYSLSREGTESRISEGSCRRTITENTRPCAGGSAILWTDLNRRGLPSWIACPRGWSQTSAAARFPTQRLIETSRCPSFLRTANAPHGSEAAVLLAANIVFQTHVVAQSVDKARAEILRVEIGIMDGDNIFKLIGAGFANPLGGNHHVRMRGAGCVQECLLVEAGRLN